MVFFLECLLQVGKTLSRLEELKVENAFQLLLEQNKILENNLSKQFKLLSKKDFSNLRETPLFHRSSFFWFYYKKTELSNSRIGISISKKGGNAVFRNKIKRIIREVYRNHNVKSHNLDLNIVLNTKKITKNSNHKLESDQIHKDLLQSFNYLSNQ